MIELQNVSKMYRLGLGQKGLRAALQDLPKRIFIKDFKPSENRFWALRDINLKISPGEAVGIIGRNGAGKTTCLKLMSKITYPTTGKINISGKVSALVELGAGFHPDLTGRENVYLNGTILGLKKREIDAKFDQIVEFSELANFMDTPVKRYSSGMYARLGFSVAAHINPDILLVDEVLSVGDSNFQQKCFDFIHSFVNSGKITVFVTHNLYAAEQLCQRLIWLDHGIIQEEGNPSYIVKKYLEFMEDISVNNEIKISDRNQQLMISNVALTDSSGNEKKIFQSGEDITVILDYQTSDTISRPYFCIWVSDNSSPDPLFAANMIIDGQNLNSISGKGKIRCKFKMDYATLMPKVYYVWVEVYGQDRSSILFKWQKLAAFQIIDSSLFDNIEDKKGITRFSKTHGSIRIPYEWKFD